MVNLLERFWAKRRYAKAMKSRPPPPKAPAPEPTTAVRRIVVPAGPSRGFRSNLWPITAAGTPFQRPRVQSDGESVTLVAASAVGRPREDKSPPYMSELGTTNLPATDGVILEDYNAELQNLTDRMARYEEMRRSDSALAVMEHTVSMPIRGAQWRIVPGSSQKVADRISQNLWEEMTHSFGSLLTRALLAPLYGFAPMEKCWRRQADDWMGWQKFPDRDRSSIEKWAFDSTGGLRGFYQTGILPGSGEWISQKFIPIEKLLIWTWREERGNPEGLGAFRQAWKHFRYKTAFEELAAILIEACAVGIWLIQDVPGARPEATTVAEINNIIAVMNRVRSGEEQRCLYVPSDFTVQILWPGSAQVPFETHLEREHRYILQSVLAQFVGMASGGDAGGFTASKDASSIMLMMLTAVADWLADVFNKYAIPQIERYNWGFDPESPQPGQEGYHPAKLDHGRIEMRDVDQLARFIATIFNPKLAIPPEARADLMEEIGLPRMKTEQIVSEMQKAQERSLPQATGPAPGGPEDPQWRDQQPTDTAVGEQDGEDD